MKTIEQIAVEALNKLDQLPVDCVLERTAIIKAAIEKATDTLEAQLHATNMDAVELLHFASLVEPYVSDAHCHGKTALDKKLYDACFNIRAVINRNVRKPRKGTASAREHR